MIGDELIFGSVRSLADAVRTRKVSPVELTETYLQRLETIGPRLNAVVSSVVTVARCAGVRSASSNPRLQ